MSRNYLRHAASMLVILIAALACALPGQTVQPAPVSNPINIETAVAGTAQAAAQQTEQANPATATDPVISTNTPVTPEVVSSFQTSLVKLADGSTQFRDYRAGVQILFPSNWLLVRPGEPEYYRALEKEGTQSQWILEEIAALQDLDLNIFRVIAYDMHPEHFLNEDLPRVNFIFQAGDPRALQEVEADEKRMIKNSVFAGHEFLGSDFQTNSAGMETLVFEDQSGSGPLLYNKGTYLKIPTGLVVIDLFISSEQKEILSPEYDQIVGSITVFNP